MRIGRLGGELYERDGDRRAPSKAAGRVCEAGLGQDRGVDSVREIAELVDRLVQLSLGLGKEPLQRRGPRFSRVQAETNGDGEQALLRAVVEVALHLPRQR